MAQSSITPTTSVVSMLGMIPKCSVPCVMEDLFTSGGCPMTNAQDLATCACTNTTMQAELSACVQKSCGFLDQNQVVQFADGLCAAFPIESRVHELKTASIATIILAALFLFLRLYSRWLKTRRLWSDDAYAIIAAALLITVSIIILEMSLKGFGLHYWDVPTSNAVELLKLFYVCQMLYVAVQVFSKVAILALYLRLFPDFITWFRWSVRGMITFMFVHGLAFFFLVVFQCWPIRSIWDKTVIDAKCLPVSAVIGFTGAALSIVEDIIILLLPLPLIWKLQMSTRKKIGVILLISVGSFASITSIVRLKFFVKYSNSYDSTWDNVDVIKWSLIEILAACICGNLLPLRPLIEQAMPNFRSIYSWYSDRRSSRKSSDKASWGLRSFGMFGRSGGSSKPRLISTLHFSQISLSPTSTPDWDRKHSIKSDQNTMISPRTPTPAYFEKRLDDVDEDYVQDVPHGIIRKTSTTVLRSTQTGSTMVASQTTTRPSRDGSETDLVPPTRDREHRISGPWSRALAVLDRR
ncbi:uncharacterized protein EKO05_0005463 [Ascochyta rabiei]|uniref:uncharacterized protein n=1 Tax=Didymella rabiei TaxID=5454 RepID=UPI0019022552|nr:uncharacterized protein EKO05_0005463 [Ascochyta rabiei]UPX14995.1 hypothetical protein EKO05_0005463 [Ascochyta rabiei]